MYRYVSRRTHDVIMIGVTQHVTTVLTQTPVFVDRFWVCFYIAEQKYTSCIKASWYFQTGKSDDESHRRALAPTMELVGQKQAVNQKRQHAHGDFTLYFCQDVKIFHDFSRFR